MTRKTPRSDQAGELRRRAEAETSADEDKTPDSLTPEDPRRVLHELQVHQIELEMQNEELRRTQAELEDSRERYFDLYDLAPVGYVTLSEKGVILEANLTIAGLLGVARGALAKRSLSRFVAPEDQNIYYLHRRQLVATGAPQTCEVRMLRAGAAPFWARLEATAAQTADGAPQCRVVVSDITERKQAEQTLRESDDRIRKKLDAILSPEGDIGTLALADVIDTAALQRIMDGICRITRYSSAIVDLQGKVLAASGWQDICTQFHRVHPETCKHCRESDVVLSAGVRQGEFKTYKCRNNLWDTATPIVVGGAHLGNLFLGQFVFEGEPLDYDAFRAQARRYGFDEDKYLAALDRVPRRTREEVNAAMDLCARLSTLISTLSYSRIKLSRALMEGEHSKEQLEQYTTALETANKALEESNRRAERASRAKSDFLANMSHELRTPLNAVIGFSEGLLERADIHPLNDHQKDRVAKIKNSGEYLLQLINGVLDIAKVESGKIDVRIATFDVEPVVWEIGDMAEALVKSKPGIRFAVDLEKPLPPIASDRDKIRQILVNLLGNAIKFTNQGVVRLRVQNKNRWLAFSVEDTGIGIPAENLGHLFEQFYQVMQESACSLKGTGLGLAISKAFATLLGGELTVESVEGQGSTFTLTVPLTFDRRKGGDRRRAVRQAATPGLSPPQSQLQSGVLCVDADPTSSGSVEAGKGQYGDDSIG